MKKTDKVKMFEASLSVLHYVLDTATASEFKTCADLLRNIVEEQIDTDLFFGTETNNRICLNQISNQLIGLSEVLELIDTATINQFLKDR